MGPKLIFSVRKKDLEIQTFCTGGPGGQNQNKNQNGVRIVHRESGLSAESRTFKSQGQNKKAAFRKLARKLVDWFLRQESLQDVRARTDEIVRTYHEPDNRVVDKASGHQQQFREVIDDPSQMIEARKSSMEAVDRDTKRAITTQNSGSRHKKGNRAT